MPRPWMERFKRPGQFIKDYLVEHGQGSIAEIHQAFSDRIREENKMRRQQGHKRLLRKPTYHSFYAYFRQFFYLGLVKRVGEDTEVVIANPDDMAFVERRGDRWRIVHGARRRFWALTAEGQGELTLWDNPRRSQET